MPTKPQALSGIPTQSVPFNRWLKDNGKVTTFSGHDFTQDHFKIALSLVGGLPKYLNQVKLTVAYPWFRGDSDNPVTFSDLN